MILEERTEIRAPPAEVFGFFEEMEDRYVEWHPDHRSFHWVDGASLETGAEAHFEERIAGRDQARTVRFTAVDPGRYIEFRPTSRLTRLFLPSISFTIEPVEGGCRLIQRIRVRTGPIGARLNRRAFEAVRRHMREEGRNLRRFVEP